MKKQTKKRPRSRLEAAAVDETFQFNATGTVEIHAGLDKDGKEDEDKVPSFSLLGYTGGVMSVWRGATVIDLAGLVLPKNAPVLHDHDASDPVGHGAPSVEGSNLTLAGTFSVHESASAQKIIASSKRGFPWQASVGVAVTKFEKAAAGQEVSVNGQTFTAGNDGLYVIRAGTLREISIVPLGADANTQVSVAARAAETEQQEHHMANEDNEVKASAGRTLEQIVADTKAERNRCSLIAAMVEEALSNPYTDIEAIEELSAKATADKWTVQDTEVAILRASRPKPFNIREGKGGDKLPRQDVLEAAVLMSTHTLPDNAVVKSFGEPTVQAAHDQYRGTIGLQELILQCAAANGYQGRGRVTESNWREMLSWAAPKQHGGQIQATGFSTVDLTGIVGNVANKALGAVAADPVWLAPQIAGTASHSNFHSHTIYSMAMNGELLPVAPTGEIQHLDLAEESYTRQVGTRGALLRISRTDIINDELGVFARNATGMARKAYTTREKALFTAINATAAGASHFTAARGNYISGATTVIGETGLDLAVKAFRGLKGPDGDPIMVEPSILLVPSTIEGTARRMLSAGSNRFTRTGETLGTAIFQSDSNIFAGRFGGAPLISPWLENLALTGYSAAKYYLLADPSQYPCFEIAYLNGAQAPTVEYFGLETQADTLGMTWRIYWDFGVGAAEWRAGVKVAGA